MTQNIRTEGFPAAGGETEQRNSFFEKAYAHPYVRDSVRVLWARNVTRFPFLREHEDDFMQDIRIYLLGELRHFNPELSDLKTFARSVLEKGFPFVRRKYIRMSRDVLSGAASLSPGSENGNEGDSAGSENLTEASENPFERAESAEQLHRCMEELRGKDLRICREIMAGKTPCGMIREGICSKRYYYDRWLPRMRKLFGECLC